MAANALTTVALAVWTREQLTPEQLAALYAPFKPLDPDRLALLAAPYPTGKIARINLSSHAR
jgi:hypothetical protein